MKTVSDKLDIALRLIESQKRLINHCYKVDRTDYSDKQLRRFRKFEDEMFDITQEWRDAICTCDDCGFIGKHFCPIHNKNK